MKNSSSESQPGVAVDARGVPAVDPTKNVIDLTRAAVQRIDDIATLREALVDEKVRRMHDNLVNIEKVSDLRSEHYKEIRHMESDRVDKIRSVDVANAATTAAQLLSAVTTLASTAAQTAETLRNQVAATAAAVASQTERVVNPIIERISILEKSSYSGAGRASATDPMTEQMMARMQLLMDSRSNSTGKSEGISMSWGIVIAVVGLILAGLLLLVPSRSNSTTSPQVIYVPQTTTPITK